MTENRFSKRGQIALFIIIGILILVSIISLFFLMPKPEFRQIRKSQQALDIEIRPCLSNALESVLPEFLSKGLYFNPKISVLYNEINVSYHCYTEQKKSICTRNDAQSKARIEKELKERIKNDIENCFDKFKKKNKAVDIEMEETFLSLEIQPKKIDIKVRKPIKIKKETEEIFLENFDVSVDSPLWDYVYLSNEIINQEVRCNCPEESCTADIVYLMKNNFQYKITFFIGSRDEKVYTIEDYTDKKNTFNFAIKNCDKTP